MQTLTTQQVHSLNSKHGAGLEESKGKMYVQSFLINSQQNQAGDPHPFRVDGKLLPKLARTAIGMPWLPYPKSDGNHQRPIGAAAFTADGIKQHQQQFAGGEIVAQYTNEGTGNVNVIIDVFPEYQEAVRSKKIPAFVSPMIFPHDMTPEGLVKEGEILHLQSVHHPGYAPEVAKINSVCEGNGLKQCMTQMKALAASGKLAPFQSKVKNYIAKNVSPADKTQMGKVKIGGETNWYDANKNEFQFSPEYKHNFPNPEKLPIVVQHEIGHMHWHHTLTPAQRKAFAKNVPKDLEISPYAIQHKRMLFKAVTAFRKDKSSKNRKAVKRAYGEYIREVFAILHSMRQEPDYVQRLKTDGLKQGMSAYMGALGAAGPSDADIQKFDRKITNETSKMSRDVFSDEKQTPSFGDVIQDTGMEKVLGRHKERPKRTSKLHPNRKSIENDWYGSITKARTPSEITKAKKQLKQIFEKNPGLGKMYAARQNAFKKLNSKQRAAVKKTPAFWRGFSKHELKDIVKTGKFNSLYPEDSNGKSLSMQKNVAENFAWGGILARYDGDALRKGKSVKPMTYGQHPDKNDDVEWQNKFIGQREALLKHGTDIFDKKGKPKIRHLHFTVKSNKTGKNVQEKYKGIAGKVTYSVKRNARYGVFGAAGTLPKKTLGKKKPKTFVDNVESGLRKLNGKSAKNGFILKNGEMIKSKNDYSHDEMLKEAIKKSYKKGFPSFKAYETSYPTQTLRKQKNPPVRYGHKSIELFGDPTSSQIKSMKDHVISNRGKVKYLEMSHMDLNDKKELAESRMRKRLGIDYLGEEGQSDRAAERYKAEQSEDKILTKKNTSAKYRRQVKDDRSAYARKNPKYAALRPELRKHMSLKTRRANKMGVENMSGKSHTTRNRKMFRGDILQRNDVKNKKLKQMSPTQRRKSAENTTDARKAFAEAGVSNERRRLKEIAGGKVMKVGTMRMDGTSNMRVVHPPEMFNVYTRGQGHDELKNNRKKLTRRTRVANRMGVKRKTGHGIMRSDYKHGRKFKKTINGVDTVTRFGSSNIDATTGKSDEDRMFDNSKEHRKANKHIDRMGIPPNASMIKTAFSNVLGNKTA